MRRCNFVGLAGGACCLLLGASVFGFQAAGGYHLLRKVSLGAAPGGGEYFDYITFDAAARRVYLSHGTEIKVLDADSDKVIGTIAGLKRDHGVALVPDLGRGFISDGDAAEVVIFDLKTLHTLGHVKTDKDSDSILYDPASKRIFCFNGEPNSVTVIDPANGKVISTLALGGAPEQAVADGKGMIYDNLEDKNEVVAIDSRTLKITGAVAGSAGRAARVDCHGSPEPPVIYRRPQAQRLCGHGRRYREDHRIPDADRRARGHLRLRSRNPLGRLFDRRRHHPHFP